MTTNIEIVNAAVTLIIKATLLAARFSGRARKPFLADNLTFTLRLWVNDIIAYTLMWAFLPIDLLET
jgi:hypothetical protein